MQLLNLKPTHKLVTNYYQALGQFGQLKIDHEMAVRDAFQDLLKGCGQKFHWTLVPEYSFSRPKLNPIRIDGALLDTFRLPRGYWEAKDEHDDLEKEIRAKLAKGYPSNNIIFQAPDKAVLYQKGVRQGLNQDITDSANLVELLKAFFGYREPHYEEWDAAVTDFQGYIPQIAGVMKEKIEDQRRTNPAFVARFDAFYELCRQSINPNLSVAAVEEMLIQHLMTERIFRRIFDNSDFTRRNVIAVEIEKIIDSMTAREFSRDAFLKDLDRFYRAIEAAAANTETYKQKQDFINTVYERFFQGYSPKEADTHGIVYTPQPIVDFMVRSVEDILKKEFGRSLSDKDVHILDPFVGTGNFITRVMQEIKTSALPYKYENELHCNEVMLLPYYVASMNIEHEYLERTGEYKAFPGICLVDTFDMRAQGQMFTEKNLERVERQRQEPIFVVVSNPPYNAWQVNENDNNKNRRYVDHNGVDLRVAETYSRESEATNKNALSDPYVKAFRWASDRIKEDGVIVFVSNSGFLESIAADGMRKTLVGEFDEIYILDMGGNVRKNPKLSGTTHNVFGIQVGVCISLLVRKRGVREKRVCNLYYARTDEFWRREQKYNYLDDVRDRHGVVWTQLQPDAKYNWLTQGLQADFRLLTPMAGGLFNFSSNGVKTNRDAWLYNFDRPTLAGNVKRSVEFYNVEVSRRKKCKDKTQSINDFVRYDENSISWSETLKKNVENGTELAVDEQRILRAVYRPYCEKWLCFDHDLIERVYGIPRAFPLPSSRPDNLAICVSSPGGTKTFHALCVSVIPDIHLTGDSQCFPFYIYDEDGSNRRENITDWALTEFRTHYSDTNITKWDIFHYVYAVLHHPEYRQRYAANLKRELPRIPFVTASVTRSGSAGLEAHVADEASPQPGSPLRADFARDGVGEGETIVAQGVSPGSARINEPESLQGRHILPPSLSNASAARYKETADPSTRAEALPRDDNGKGVGGNRGPSTPAAKAAASSQDDNQGKLGAPPLSPVSGDRVGTNDDQQIFRAFANAGRRLAELHVNYEHQSEYPLEHVEKGQLNWRVEKMRLGKDKTSLVYNEFLTLRGIPPETYGYRLGNRSALEWVIDQYQVSTDKRSAIVNDPNRADDPEYIVRLVGQVITVSLETMKLVKSLPPLVTESVPA